MWGRLDTKVSKRPLLYDKPFHDLATIAENEGRISDREHLVYFLSESSFESLQWQLPD